MAWSTEIIIIVVVVVMLDVVIVIIVVVTIVIVFVIVIVIEIHSLAPHHYHMKCITLLKSQGPQHNCPHRQHHP